MELITYEYREKQGNKIIKFYITLKSGVDHTRFKCKELDKNSIFVNKFSI